MLDSSYSIFLEALGKVEKLTPRDMLIMDHAYRIGFMEGVQISKDIVMKEEE